MLSAGESFAGRADSVSQARRFAEVTLGEWQLEELVWATTVLVSELATNAILHARTAFTVTLEQLGPDEIRLEVRDSSTRMPSLRTFSDEATTGRGLQLLDQLAAEWGATTHEGGKTVWVVCRAGAETGGARRAADGTDAGPLEGLLDLFDDEAPGSLADGPSVRLNAA